MNVLVQSKITTIFYYIAEMASVIIVTHAHEQH